MLLCLVTTATTADECKDKSLFHAHVNVDTHANANANGRWTRKELVVLTDRRLSPWWTVQRWSTGLRSKPSGCSRKSLFTFRPAADQSFQLPVPELTNRFLFLPAAWPLGLLLWRRTELMLQRRRPPPLLPLLLLLLHPTELTQLCGWHGNRTCPLIREHKQTDDWFHNWNLIESRWKDWSSAGGAAELEDDAGDKSETLPVFWF